MTDDEQQEFLDLVEKASVAIAKLQTWLPSDHELHPVLDPASEALIDLLRID